MSISAALPPVHGGLAAPVDRISANAAESAAALPRIAVEEVDRTTLYRIADGTLSPLTGPMNRADYESVLANGAIERKGERWAWTIPIILPVTDDEARGLSAGARNRAGTHGGQLFGTLTASRTSTTGTRLGLRRRRSTAPPRIGPSRRAKLWLARSRARSCVGGEITLVLLRRPAARSRVASCRRRRTRALDRRRSGYEQSVAFQTRNPLHRAHEYALVYGAEKLLRDTKQAHRRRS
jgi:sulfate adenylyltransferase